MSSTDRSQTYIDTNTDGLVVQIQHNLGQMVYPWLWELDSGAKVFVPLFDSRIAELKALDDNVFQVTFASAYEGYLDLIAYDLSTPSVESRLAKVEEDLLKLKNEIVLYTTQSKWKQMNTFQEGRIDAIKSDLDTLETLYQDLRADVDAL